MNNMYNDNNNVDVNKKNSEEFTKLMENASVKKDSYWDINNPFLKIFLIILLIVAVVGSACYIVPWLLNK